MTESDYPVGTLVRHLYFPQGMGIVVEAGASHCSDAFTVHWFDLNKNRREMEWEIISLEELRDDK
jgi:hypothetical protein